MRHMYVCNTSTDSISKVNIDDFFEVEKIDLRNNYLNRIGPHGICTFQDKILTANSYSNTISIIDINNNIENHYIGVHCNDIKTLNDYAYIICGELNNMVIFDLKKKCVLEEIPCGNAPHSIDINKFEKKILISNMQNDSITLIDCEKNQIIKHIKVGAYPTKAIFSSDGNYVLVCESNIGMNSKGCISVVSLKNFRIINRIPVGKSPVDIFSNENYCYVSNFGEGTISVVDLSNYKEIKRIEVGGMPRGIIENNNYVYVGDNYNNLLIKVHTVNERKDNISIGGEPTGIIMV